MEVKESIRIANEKGIVYSCANQDSKCMECGVQNLNYITRDIVLAVAHSVRNNMPTWIVINK